MALRSQGKLDEAIAEYREAVRHQARRRRAHNNLGNALSDQGKLDEAIAEYRAAIRLKPDFAEAHYNLGNALRDQGKLDEAIAEYRAAFGSSPITPRPTATWGLCFGKQGPSPSARRAQTGPRTGIEEPELAYSIGASGCARPSGWSSSIESCRRSLSGREKPADAAESLTLAQMCYDKKLHAASARFWAEAFQAQPNLADDMNVQNRYNAACAAALAGSGEGKDDPPLDDAKKAHWRKQAMDWLKADLAAWSKILESGPPQAKPFIVQDAPALESRHRPGRRARRSRAGQALGRRAESLPALWAEVDALLAKAQGTGAGRVD